MDKKRQTIDGFTPRRPRAAVSKIEKNDKKPAIERKKQVADREKSLDDALNTIEIEDRPQQKTDHIRGERSRRREQREKISPKIEKKLDKVNSKRDRKGKKPLSLKQFLFRRKIRRALAVFLIIGLLFFGSKIYSIISNGMSNLNKISSGGNIFDVLSPVEKLKQDEDGRTNILIFGTSPEGWDGEDLADSIMVLSTNQETGKSYTISLPRDLWVKHKCPYLLGTTAGKLNESYVCGKFSEGIYNNKTASEEKKKQGEKLGQQEIAAAAERVLGLKIHYSVHANWQVLVQAIDAIGGIDVKVEVWDGSPYIYDVATKVRYKNGEVAHMNGEQALAFSRARGSAGGYGLSGGNFDRERNQQKILKATLEKINKQKFNIDALIGIADALGDNVKTDFTVKEIRSGLDLALKTSADKVKSLPMVDEKTNLLTNDNISGVSAVVPTAGLYDYSAIHKFVAKNTKTGDFISEEAKIIILNGTEISGLAGKKQAQLEKDGFEVAQIGDSAEKGVKSTKIYDISKEKPLTLKKLQEKLSVSKVEDLPSKLNSWKNKADILVILGENE